MSEDFRLASVFTDHMVLCQNRPIRLFGQAQDGTQLTATLHDSTASTTAQHGRFEILLPPMPAGGAYTLTVTDGHHGYTFVDVLIGEVYLAGGQSNMELELQNADDGQRLVAQANNNQIRYYNVPKQPWLTQQALENERSSRWQALTPGMCADMSAVAYHFAARLQTVLQVPVGIIDCYWGGTSAACWQDEASLVETKAGEHLLRTYQARIANKTDEQYAIEVKAHDDGVQAWNDAVTALRQAKPTLGWVEINQSVGACPWNPPEGRTSPFRPAGLVETMLKRVAPYTLTGALFYQGEEDTKHPHLYQALLVSLIVCWRRLFKNEYLPFLFVQLPMYIEASKVDDHSWAELRQAQMQTLRLVRNTGMAVTIDCGEVDNIHPTDKKPIGDRLCLQAMKVVHGQAADSDGPYICWAWKDADALVLRLTAPAWAQGEPLLFELAGEDGVYHPAKVQLLEDIIRLTAKEVAQPCAARYAWVNFGHVNVYGIHGLPLAPFEIQL